MTKMLDAYQQLDYERAETFAQEVLSNYRAYPLDVLTRVHTTLGIIKYARNNPSESREQFEAALSIDPELTLDPALVSPKILAFFAEIKDQESRPDTAVAGAAQVRYIVLKDPRPAAAMRSMIWPGLGQMYKGEQKKGLLLTGLWSVTAGGAVIAHFQRQQAGRLYRRSREPENISDLYNTYNRRNKVRNGLVLAAAGVWIYSYIDALSKPVQMNISRDNATLAVSPFTSYPYAQIQFSLLF